jgi:hypothetical protein
VDAKGDAMFEIAFNSTAGRCLQGGVR